MSKTYEQGLQDGLEMYGRVCTKIGNCNECPIGAVRGSADVSCQEVLAKFPAKAVSLLSEEDGKDYTYINEFHTRLPQSNLSDEDIIASLCCFDLFGLETPDSCHQDCEACWNKRYGDAYE